MTDAADVLPDNRSGGASEEHDTFLNLLGWPPPGLARVQGDLWRLARKMVLAGAVLVLPVLLVVTLPQRHPGLGPLGDSWWVLLITAAVGLLLFLDAMVALVRVLRRALHAFDEGYSAHVVGQVMADGAGDGGFLLQGAQVFSMLSRTQLVTLARLRLWAPIAHLGAGLWLNVAFGVLLLLAARTGLSIRVVAMGTLLPSAGLLLAGVALRLADWTFVKRARRAWFKQPWAAELSHRDASEWREAAAARGAGSKQAPAGMRWSLRLCLVASLVSALFVVLPPITLLPVASVGPVLFTLIPPFEWGDQSRRAAVEPYRHLAVDHDPSVSAEEAGVLLNTLLYVGGDEPVEEGTLPPARIHTEAWLPEPLPEGWPLGERSFWTSTIWSKAEGGFSGEEREYLMRMAAHPAHEEFARLAHASTVDVAGGRYVIPFSDDLGIWTIPYPSHLQIAKGAWAHLAIGALRAAEGRHADAERHIREVISVGLVLIDEAVDLGDQGFGGLLVQAGGAAMVPALRLAGEDLRADRLLEAVAVTETATAVMAPGRKAEANTPFHIEMLHDRVADPSVSRGQRWVDLGTLNAIIPCMNLQRLVFGPGEEHAAWLAGVERSLVRFPSEQALFDLELRGFSSLASSANLARMVPFFSSAEEAMGGCLTLLAGLWELAP